MSLSGSREGTPDGMRCPFTARLAIFLILATTGTEGNARERALDGRKLGFRGRREEHGYQQRQVKGKGMKTPICVNDQHSSCS
ncbi:unnamed protein product [Sphagnum jensenii]|uniref:Secreted protein n=1 Tax=Sphagnum jensenii TaxID=128206 RepID=A0ABP1BEA2_9BRYO